MSFPYQYVDYSNPATPRVYSWDVASEQDALQIQQQDQHDQAALQQQQHLQQQQQQRQQQQIEQQQERVSPSQLQLQQLPPPPPPPLLTPQEVQHQQPQQHQQQQRTQYTPHPQTISLQPAKSQPQYRFDNITEEYFTAQAQAGSETRPGSSSSSRRRGTSKPPLHVDTSRPASSVASPSALSSTGGGVGPLRAPAPRAHAQSAHPYRRPQSRAASGGSSTRGASVGAPGSAPVRTRRVSEMQSAQTSAGGAVSSGATMPAVGTAMAVSCPASDTWKEGLLGLSEFAGQGEASHDPETTPTATTHAQAHALHAEPMRRYSIRADIHYNTEENFIIAVFELPGVKRQDLRITMSMCPFTRVRQVNIAGISRPAVPMHGHGVRERKYGQFMRTLPVPPETKPEDVQISLEDGVLTLKIPGGTPAQAEDRHILAIP